MIQLSSCKLVELSASLHRVFVVGHDKCGARSIADFFCRNGYKMLRWQKERIANKMSENSHLSKALLFGIGCANLHTNVESAGGPESAMGRSFFQNRLYDLLDVQHSDSLFIYNYREQRLWLQSRLNRSDGIHFADCRNHLQASREGDCEVTALDVVDWWQKAWCSLEEEVFYYFKKQENSFKFNINFKDSFNSSKRFFGKVGSKIKTRSLSRKGVDKNKNRSFQDAAKRQSKKVGVYLAPVKDPNGEYRQLLRKGIRASSKYKLAKKYSDCDIILMDVFRSSGQDMGSLRNYASENSIPFVGVDFSDGLEPLGFDYNFDRFFKRSNTMRSQGISDKMLLRPGIYPISYCCRYDFRPHALHAATSRRDIDVSCFFEVSGGTYRNEVAAYLKQLKRNYCTLKWHVGVVGSQGRLGRNKPQIKYINLLKRSKICVTANPDNWEGDWRFWEAFVMGAYVLVDPMSQPPPMLQQGVDYDFYYSCEDLEAKIKRVLGAMYLSGPAEIQRRIDLAVRYHMPSNRIEYMLASCNHTSVRGEMF